VFAKVIEGMDVVDKISKGAARHATPKTPVPMIKVTVTET